MPKYDTTIGNSINIDKIKDTDMSRKKTLEKEFSIRVKEHKTYIIMEALARSKNGNIYNSELLKEFKKVKPTPIEGCESEFSRPTLKAYHVEEELKDRAENGEQELYNQIYEFCWKKVCKYQDEGTPEQYGLCD